MKTGFTAVKLALAGFIVPYMFVYNTELLLLDTTLIDGIRVAITSCIGVFLISAACEGYLYTKVNPIVRIAMMAGAFLLISSSLITDIAGVVVFVAILFLQKFMAKKAQPVTA